MAMLNNQRVYVKVNEWGILSMQPTIFWCDQWRFCVLVDEWQYLGEFCLGSTSAWSWYIPKLIWTTVCRFNSSFVDDLRIVNDGHFPWQSDLDYQRLSSHPKRPTATVPSPQNIQYIRRLRL